MKKEEIKNARRQNLLINKEDKNIFFEKIDKVLNLKDDSVNDNDDYLRKSYGEEYDVENVANINPMVFKNFLKYTDQNERKNKKSSK